MSRGGVGFEDDGLSQGSAESMRVWGATLVCHSAQVGFTRSCHVYNAMQEEALGALGMAALQRRGLLIVARKSKSSVVLWRDQSEV